MEYFVIGGEFSSLNFHKFRPGTEQINGPFATRTEAENLWSIKSEGYRHMAGYRFIIVEAKK